MRPTLLGGPLLILLWQVAPVQVQPDSTGRYRVSLGFGTGQFEERSLNCAGDVVSARPVDFRSGGAQLDVWPTDWVRVSAFGGALSSPSGETFDFAGPFGGAVVAVERRTVGIGAGVAQISGDDGITAPSGYLRLGNIDLAHFRFDFLAPSPTFGTTGIIRMGVGFNQGHLRGLSGFLGLGVGLYSDESHTGGLFGEFSIPAGRQFDIALRGAWRPSYQYADWGTSIGGRYIWGR